MTPNLTNPFSTSVPSLFFETAHENRQILPQFPVRVLVSRPSPCRVCRVLSICSHSFLRRSLQASDYAVGAHHDTDLNADPGSGSGRPILIAGSRLSYPSLAHPTFTSVVQWGRSRCSTNRILPTPLNKYSGLSSSSKGHIDPHPHLPIGRPIGRLPLRLL